VKENRLNSVPSGTSGPQAVRSLQVTNQLPILATSVNFQFGQNKNHGKTQKGVYYSLHFKL